MIIKSCNFPRQFCSRFVVPSFTVAVSVFKQKTLFLGQARMLKALLRTCGASPPSPPPHFWGSGGAELQNLKKQLFNQLSMKNCDPHMTEFRSALELRQGPPFLKRRKGSGSATLQSTTIMLFPSTAHKKKNLVRQILFLTFYFCFIFN